MGFISLGETFNFLGLGHMASPPWLLCADLGGFHAAQMLGDLQLGCGTGKKPGFESEQLKVCHSQDSSLIPPRGLVLFKQRAAQAVAGRGPGISVQGVNIIIGPC